MNNDDDGILDSDLLGKSRDDIMDMLAGHEVIIARKFTNRLHAQLCGVRLLKEGIPCYLANNNMNDLFPTMSASLGELRLYIRSSELKMVSDILREMDENELRGKNEAHSANGNVKTEDSLINKSLWIYLALLIGAALLYFISFQG